MHAYDITIFTNSRFHSLHGDDNDIVLKNLQFETHFQMSALLGSQKHCCCVDEWAKCIKSFPILVVLENGVVQTVPCSVLGGRALLYRKFIIIVIPHVMSSVELRAQTLGS